MIVKKFVWNSQLELTNKLAVDYTLNAVKGTNVLDSSNNEIKELATLHMMLV